MKRRNFLVLILVMLAFFIACSSDEGNDPEIIDETRSIIVQGHVSSITDYGPIESSDVEIEGNTTQTDFDGNFSLAAENIAAKGVLSIKKTGYVTYTRSLEDYKGSPVVIEAYLKPVDIIEEIDPDNSEGNTVVTDKGASVKLPQLLGIGENLNVSVTSFDVSTEDIGAVPGNFSAMDSEGADVNIISQGMIDVTITGANSGTEYGLDGMGPFEITIPITGDPSQAPDTIALWFFDTDTGKWMEQGQATKTGNFYIGTVTHFTTWNADFKYAELARVAGAINDPDPAPPANESYSITLRFAGYTKTVVQSGNDTSFEIINLPVHTDMAIYVTKMSSNQTWRKDFTTPGDGETIQLGNFPGPEHLLDDVTGLTVVLEGSDMTVSWTGEPANPEFSGVEVTIAAELTETEMVAPGTYFYEFIDVEEGLYKVTVKTAWTDDRLSGGLVKYVRTSGLYMVTVTNYDTSELYDYVSVVLNDNTETEFLYDGPFTVPSGTQVQLELLGELSSSYWRYFDNIEMINPTEVYEPVCSFIVDQTDMYAEVGFPQ